MADATTATAVQPALSVLLTVLALLPHALLVSAATFLCLWLGKSWFVFLRSLYVVRNPEREGRERRRAALGAGGIDASSLEVKSR